MADVADEFADEATLQAYGASSVKELSAPVKALEEKWKLIPAFQRVRGLVKQHIASFDQFVNQELKKILATNAEIRSDHNPSFFVKYLDIRVGPPVVDEGLVEAPVTPHVCRLRDLTYAGRIFVDVRYVMDRKILTARNVPIGMIPIMLRSSNCVLTGKTPSEMAKMKECPHDPGGYFIVKGVEKVILTHEQLSKNRIILESDPKIDEAPLVVVFKAMGIECDQEIAALIGPEPDVQEALYLTLLEAQDLSVFSEHQALEWLGKKIRAKRTMFTRNFRTPVEEAHDVLCSVVLQNVPTVRFNLRPKALYMAQMARRVILAHLGRDHLDDKDYFGNKRLELAGQMLALLFEDLFKRFNEELKKTADMVLSKPNRAASYDVIKSIRQDLITQGLANAIASGNWSAKRFKLERAGVTEQLTRLSYISAVGMMSRVKANFEKTRKVSGPRALQPSQWGMMCPSDTPEGEACGLVKNLALMAHVTTDLEEEPVLKLLFCLGMQDCHMMTGEELYAEGSYLVFFNGILVGVHTKPKQFATNIRKCRRSGVVGLFVSVFVNDVAKCVQVACDGGRICRPLIVVENGVPSLTEEEVTAIANGAHFDTVLASGSVEYVDVNEENDIMIALDEASIKPNTTHLEIDPMTILGVVAGLIPYPHHNQSPRNTYQCAMGKQAMGTTALNQYERIDTVLYTLVYPHKPLVTTKTLDMINFDSLPGGQNAIVAVMSYSGYDIEDATILNKASLDRGFGRCIVTRKSVAYVKKYANGSADRIVGPPAELIGLRGAKLAHIDADGLARVGEEIGPGTVLVNKESPVNQLDRATGPDLSLPDEGFKPSPLLYKAPAEVKAVVDRVMITTNSYTDQKIIKVALRQVRRPELGDKFSSRHGQKGVCGLIVNQENMPFNDQGVCPDLIMNPHGFPSRMTIGKMIELLAGKAEVMDGIRRYGTAFGGTTVQNCSEALVAAGFHYAGKENLMSGITGEPQTAYTFFGPVYYQKLKHMVMDKMHARSRGPRANLTRQPTEGRSKDGGLRMGEMERDCLIGYGAAMLVQERLMLSSDVFNADVCKACGLLASGSWCQYCGTGRHIAVVRMPYACKLLFQELQSMNVVPRLTLKDQ